MMIDAVFISDLHLHPDMPEIAKRFEAFLAWVKPRARALYILGDFFHVWAGDDTASAWSDEIAEQLRALSDSGMSVYFMRGNRDFLLGDAFFKQAKLIPLDEPAPIILGDIPVILVHGDRYCTEDKAHQWLRRLTRNCWFDKAFMRLPKWLRMRIVMGVRAHSATNPRKQQVIMDVVPESLTSHLKACGVQTVIHGHTHKPGHTEHQFDGMSYQQYVLSDWDAPPSVLCYDKTTGFYFNRIEG